jgi:hypothetical protein
VGHVLERVVHLLFYVPPPVQRRSGGGTSKASVHARAQGDALTTFSMHCGRAPRRCSGAQATLLSPSSVVCLKLATHLMHAAAARVQDEDTCAVAMRINVHSTTGQPSWTTRLSGGSKYPYPLPSVTRHRPIELVTTGSARALHMAR